MRTRSVAWGVLAIVALLAPPLPGDEPAAKTPAGAGQPAQNSAAQADESVEQLTERARKSVVVITQTGRDGRRVGLVVLTGEDDNPVCAGTGCFLGRGEGSGRACGSRLQVAG